MGLQDLNKQMEIPE